MENIKFFTKCDGCKKKRFLVARRTVVIPLGGPGKKAKSHDFYCGPCINPLNQALKLDAEKINGKNNRH